MTNKQAIEWLKALKANEILSATKEALDIAIKAIEEYPTDKEIQDDMRRTYLGGAE